MSTKEFKPYTYLIGWSTLNKFYYGVQYNKKANPKNLWNTYFTSSKYVKKFREEFGEPDIIQVRKVFETKEKAIEWEFKVIKRMKIVSSEQWLNRSLAGQKFYKIGGQQHTEETKKKIAISKIGKKRLPFTEDHKNKIGISKSGKNNPNYNKKLSIETKSKISITRTGQCVGEDHPKYGKPLSDETKQKISQSHLGKTLTKETKQKISIANTGENNARFGKPCSQEHKKKLSEANIGKKHTDLTKQKISQSSKNKPKFECQNCKNFYTKNILIQWHGEKCKK